MSATPGRRVKVTLDTPVNATKQEAWWQDIVLGDISDPNESANEHVQLVPDIGWGIEEYQSQISLLHEGEDIDDSVILLNTPATVVSVPIQRTASELNGLGATTTRVSGDNFYRKDVAADEVWAQVLADGASYTRPDSETDPVIMDRIGVGQVEHRPDERIWMRLDTPGNGSRSIGRLARIYFTGIPTYLPGDSLAGSGQYALTLFGDGAATLQEREISTPAEDPEEEPVLGTWITRRRFQWAPKAGVMGASHVIVIRSDAKNVGGVWTGSYISFEFQSFFANTSLLVATVMDLVGPRFQTYRTSQRETVAPQLEPLRIDIRRDIRARFQLSQSKYYATGKIRTKTQGIPFKVLDPDPENPVPIRVCVFGAIPSGTSITDFKLFGATDGTECDVLEGGTTDDATFLGKWFKAIPGERLYYAELLLVASDDQFKAPWIHRIVFLRDAVVDTTVPTPVDAHKVTKLSISGASSDPTHETAAFECVDLDGHLDRLKSRSELPIIIKVLAPADPDVVPSGQVPATRSTKATWSENAEDYAESILFSGRMIKCQRHIRGVGSPKQGRGNPTAALFPSSYWSRYSLTCVGDWYKLMEIKAPKRFDFHKEDPTDGIAPYKVTTAIRALFQSQGYTESELDIPDVPIRFLPPFSDDQSLLIEPHTELGPIIVKWIREWLGGYLVRDMNASSTADPMDEMGMWRIKIPPKPPYTVMANFLLGPPDGSPAGVTTIDEKAYPPDESTPQTFIRKGSLSTVPQAPEGNWVLVEGVGAVNAGISLSRTRIVRPIINWNAADFGQNGEDHPLPDPEHPDYTDGQPKLIYYSDPYLDTQQRVDWAARRIYDYACHGRVIYRWESPLVLITDPTDTLQVRRRPLRYGDIVMVDSALCYISSVSIGLSAGSSRNQMAGYEAISVPALTQGSSPTHQLHTTILGMMGFGGR